MKNHPFGPTKCGDILEERIAVDKIYSRKVRAFYNESMSILASLKDVKASRSRQILRDLYLRARMNQFRDDLFLYRPITMSVSDYVNLVNDIQQRLEYLLRHGSRYLTKS